MWTGARLDSVAVLTLPIREVRIETPRARRVTLSLSGHVFDFRAGQAAWLRQPGRPVRKPYSIACSPEQARAVDGLEFLVQISADGTAGPHLDAPAPGMFVEVDGPMGSFCFPPRPRGKAFLFVAGGTGIAPLRAMLWHALAAFPDRRFAMWYSVRSADEFAYGDELRLLAETGKIVLRERVTRDGDPAWTGERGRIARQDVAPYAGPDTLCCVCGPPALVQDVTGWLRDLGVPDEQILAERAQDVPGCLP